MATKELRRNFLSAASEGNLTLLKSLAGGFDNGEGLAKACESVKDDEGRTALHLAAAAGKTQICKYLIDKLKLDVNVRDDAGDTPLLHAILEQRHPTAVYLIEIGADIGRGNNRGFTALHSAAEKGNKEMLRLLILKGAKMDINSESGTPLQCAALCGKKVAVKILLDKGSNPNSVTQLYFMPLMLSIIAKSFECFELLLKAGADPNLASCGKTPLIVAACEGEKDIIKHLLKVVADPNVTDTIWAAFLLLLDFDTLYNARAVSYPEVKNGGSSEQSVDKDIQEQSGVTPLEHAALRGQLAAVMALFPVTSPISSFPNWSVAGIMKHVLSEEARAQRELRRRNVFQMSKAKGQDAFKRKDYMDAVYWYSEANLADPTDATVLSNRSLCWALLNQGKEALSDAEACTNLRPDWPKAHYREGAAWMLLENYSMASEAFSVALNLDPGNKEIQMAMREAVEAEFGMPMSENLKVLRI